MDEKLKEKITQRLDMLPDERGWQLLDYIEYLESKYNRSERTRSTLERLADNVEGTLRGSRLGEAAFKGTTQILEAAGSVVRGVAAAGRTVVEEFEREEQTPPESAAGGEANREDSVQEEGPTSPGAPIVVSDPVAPAPDSDPVEPAPDERPAEDPEDRPSPS